MGGEEHKPKKFYQSLLKLFEFLYMFSKETIKLREGFMTQRNSTKAKLLGNAN